MLRCGQTGVKIRFTRGGLLENRTSEHPQQSPRGAMGPANWAVYGPEPIPLPVGAA